MKQLVCECKRNPVLLRIFLQFEAVGSAFYCWVNGIMVGYAQDTFMSSEFDVTELLKPGSNHLAVQASLTAMLHSQFLPSPLHSVALVQSCHLIV